jgi:hypothetical protein
MENILKLRIDSFKKPEPSLRDPKDNPCWKGYKPVGVKPNGDPNCVPVGKSEDFVIPSPKSGEHTNSYISRCMKAIGDEYDTQEQALAVCYSQLK